MRRSILLSALLVCATLANAERPRAGALAISGLTPVEAPTCEDEASDPSHGKRQVRSDEAGRAAAQKGLDFLQREAVAWDERQQCYGCHVHAVTAEALSVGVAHQYDVDMKAMKAIVAGMTTGPGGSRQTEGMNYAHGGSLRTASKAFGASAFARYDALVGRDLGDDLLSTAHQLLATQDKDGAVVDAEGWVNAPVGIGRVQLTTQALAAWRQAYERTADDTWLAAVGKGETWLRQSMATQDPGTMDHQTRVFALLGLLDAGAGVTHPDVKRLLDAVLAAQAEDGSWSMSPGTPAYATGQALYVLRKAGFTDRDPVVAKGTRYLTDHQLASGGWSARGFGKAEAMWGVLGLVSIDVLSLTVQGLEDGQHVRDRVSVTALAKDNQGRGVRDVQLFVDDVRIGAECGDTLAATWDTRGLTPGAHVVEVRAANHRGDMARRRLVVYSGDTRLVEPGSRWEDDGTLLSVRDLAPGGGAHKVELTIHAMDGEGAEAGRAVHDTWTEGRQGALKFWWDGKDEAGAAQPRAKYLARFRWKDAQGAVVHTLDHVFVHARPEMQRATYGQVGGRIQFEDGSSAANATVELVDEEGRVVRQARSTAEGAWSFRNVDAKKYKVRIRKDSEEGPKEAEVAVEPAAGEATSADVEL